MKKTEQNLAVMSLLKVFGKNKFLLSSLCNTMYTFVYKLKDENYLKRNDLNVSIYSTSN